MIFKSPPPPRPVGYSRVLHTLWCKWPTTDKIKARLCLVSSIWLLPRSFPFCSATSCNVRKVSYGCQNHSSGWSKVCASHTWLKGDLQWVSLSPNWRGQWEPTQEPDINPQERENAKEFSLVMKTDPWLLISGRQYQPPTEKDGGTDSNAAL